MKKSNLYLSAAVMSAFALTSCDTGQKTGGDTAAQTDNEKCYGVAKAGKNQCGAKEAGTSCEGSSTVDADPNAWVYLPKGMCERIVGGNLTHGG